MFLPNLSLSKNPKFDLAVSELRTLLERFANGTSMSIIFDAFNVLVDDSRRDPALKEWFKAVDLYIRKVQFVSLRPSKSFK